ncbi:beta-lactamase [Paenibacillus dendritiformis C454]|uniref:Beta-lactamase n=1 Tax=Paenibacillus dendritiformis C454 TaxID=1131935 RepID=H3SA70_9BACL|nr:beta-lactamase [Paenibacillus dendritiformis C454]
MSNSYAAGGMYSTVDDLHALERALSSGQLVSASALGQMHTPHSGDYGLGWFILPPDRQLIYHHGGINGFTASFMCLPQQQAAVIVLSNVAWSVTSELAHELATMLMPH